MVVSFVNFILKEFDIVVEQLNRENGRGYIFLCEKSPYKPRCYEKSKHSNSSNETTNISAFVEGKMLLSSSWNNLKSVFSKHREADAVLSKMKMLEEVPSK